MAKQETTPKFELSTLDANNLKELDGYKVKMEKIVEDHPFVEIIDNETYKTAKTARTALKSGRTEIQSQDKTIATFIRGFRTKTKEIGDSIIAIVQPYEEKQQSEIDRWETILEEKRKEKALAEEKRIHDINVKIETTKENLKQYVESMTFPNIQSTLSTMKNEIKLSREFDFEEYEPMFDEMVNDQLESHQIDMVRLMKEEEERTLNIKRSQEAKINELIVRATEMIDETGFLNKDTLIKSVESLFGIDFDFGDFTKRKEEAKENLLNKSKAKLESIDDEIKRRKEIKTQENKNRIINVREGLFDKIFQMDVDDYQDDLDYVNEALKQKNPFPELEKEFNDMLVVVKKNLNSKKEIINSQIKHREKEAYIARVAINTRTKQRGKQLEEIGFTFHNQKTENYYDSLLIDSEIWESLIEGLTDDDWNDYFNDISKRVDETKANNKAFKERQKSLKKDKELMIDYLNSNAVQLNLSAYCDNEETSKLAEQIEESFDLFIKTKIETINKF